MLILACVALAVLLVPLTGGRLARLGRIRWRQAWLLPLALVVQVVVMELPGVPVVVGGVLHVLTYVAAAVVVWRNRHVTGLWLLALGAGLNGAVITLNGGTLPASAHAQAGAGVEQSSGFANSAVVAEPVLPFLGDVFHTPAWVPLANVFSAGDVLVVAGAVWVLVAATRRRPDPARPPVALPG